MADAFVDELCTLFKVPPKDEIILYALTFQNKRDLESYIKDILGDGFVHQNKAIGRCLSLWKPSMSGLNREESVEYDLFSTKKKMQGTKKKNIVSQERNDKKEVNKMTILDNVTSVPYKQKDLVVGKPASDDFHQNIITKSSSPPTAKRLQSNIKLKKKPHKFVSLYTPEGKNRAEEIMVIPGRHACECAGQKHKLVSNCLECGRIVCDQEGSGPCLFCGNLVCTVEEQEIISRNSKASSKLYQKLMKNTQEECQMELDKAKALKDKLIEFDRTSARRTKVIDDQADYYSSDSKWLSKKERGVARKKEGDMYDQKHQSRLNRKYVLDFTGREVREDIPMNTFLPPDDEDMQEELGVYNSAEMEGNVMKHVNKVDPKIKNINAPTFTGISQHASIQHKTQSISNNNPKRSLRIQDDDIQKISDHGLCLSMHQPWASLLVTGIKTVEGRSWYTAHRGRLWIASTAKPPEQEEIKFVQEQYKGIYERPIEFPENYPSGALLGCVDVIDCVNQEEYQKMDGDTTESGSEFVFVCDNPIELLIKVPVKGKHKIWKLESQVHKLAKASIMQQ